MTRRGQGKRALDGTRRTCRSRARFRAGLRVPTASLAPGFAQANLTVLAADAAAEFGEFARRNPAPCPLLDVTRPGSTRTRLAAGADLRTDLPAYRVWRTAGA